MPMPPVVQREARRLAAGDTEPRRVEDGVAVEEPLEIRVAGEPVAVTMRTPGEDAHLAVGFLFSEGLLASIEDVGTLSHCGRPGEEGYGNVLEVVPAAGAAFDRERLRGTRRGTLTTAACGVCGRQSIEDLLALCGRLPEGPTVAREVLAGSTGRLREAQATFSRTGGTHAAAVLSAEGSLLAFAEDVGRHNAVDKVVGALVHRRLILSASLRPLRPLPSPRPALLVVSGRASFEIIQKAAVAGLPLVAAVGAASSLAIDLARHSRVTLATFVRDGGFNLYTCPERVGP